MKDKLIQEWHYKRGSVSVRVRHINKNGSTDPDDFSDSYFDIATDGGTPSEQAQAIADTQVCLVKTFQKTNPGYPGKVTIEGAH